MSRESDPVDRKAGFPGRSAIEADVLSDGEVSYAELERAALHMVRCIEDALGVEGSATYRGDSFAFDFHDPQNQMNEKMERFAADFDACEAEINEIQTAWADQIARVGRGDDQYEVVRQCLRRAGIDVGSGSPTDLSRASELHPYQYQTCLTEAFP